MAQFEPIDFDPFAQGQDLLWRNDNPGRNAALAEGTKESVEHVPLQTQLRNMLEPSPGWNYGNVLPIKTMSDEYGGLHGELAIPNALRDLGVGALDLLEGPRTGTITKEGLGALMALPASNLLTRPSTEAVLSSIKGFHGTPYKFEPVEHNPFGEFGPLASHSKTGEGAQVYGHGYYIGGAEQTGQAYKETLTDRRLQRLARDSYDEFGDGPEAEAALLAHPELTKQDKALLNALKADDWLGFDYPHQAIRALLKEPEGFDISPATKAALNDTGSLYHVQIKPDEHELLDWDKPISPEHVKGLAKALGVEGDISLTSPGLDIFAGRVRQAGHLTRRKEELSKMSPDERVKAIFSTYGIDPSKQSGKEIYHGLERMMETSTAASKALHEAGIPGIKYLDQGSRKPAYLKDDLERIEQRISSIQDEIERSPKATHQHLIMTELPVLRQQRNALRERLNKPETSNYVIFHPSNLHITGRNGETLGVTPIDHDPFK